MARETLDEEDPKQAGEMMPLDDEEEGEKKAAAKDAAKLKELEDLQKKATALEKPEEATEAPVKPWYTSTGVLIGGGLVLGLAVYAATRKPERT